MGSIPPVRGALLAVFLFAAALVWVHPPLLADDYYWLSLPLKNPDLRITDLYTLARMPVITSMIFAVLKLGWLEAMPRVFLVCFFSVHVAAFFLLFETLLERAGQKATHFAAPFGIAAALFALQPDNYEINLWHLLSMHAVGALFIALSFRAKNSAVAIVLAVLGLMTYDTFIFLLSGFAVLLWLVSGVWRKREAAQVVISSALWLASKAVLGLWLGHLQVVPIKTSFTDILAGFPAHLEMLWLLHFHKQLWFLSLLQWIAMGALIFLVNRQKILPLKRIFVLAAAPTIVALPLCLNTYYAPRAYYGPELLQSLVFAFLLFTLTERIGFRTAKLWAPLTLLILAYASTWTAILQIKQRNYETLQANEAPLLAEMGSCREPCLLKFPVPAQGVSKDWVLPEMFWESYYDRLQLLHFPKKQIRWQIQR